MTLRFAQSSHEIDQLSCITPDNLAGAYVNFFGHVRAVNHEKLVSSLFYEAYQDLAISMFDKLLEQARELYGILSCTAVHRVGLTNIGERAVSILVCAPHREEAFLAARFLIDELKKNLPIWKKETYQDGSHTWDKGLCACDHDIMAPVNRVLEAKNILPKKLNHKRVLLIGAGGLGCPMAINLAAMGIGELVIYDQDTVAPSNLARQFIYNLGHVGDSKAKLVKKFLNKRFNKLKINSYQENFTDQSLTKFDLIVDTSDCYETKIMLSKLAYTHRVPLVIASVYQLEGECQVYHPRTSGCLLCFTRVLTNKPKTCAQVGVLSHVCSVIAGLCSHKILEILSETCEIRNQIILFEAESMRVSQIDIKQDPNCVTCGASRD